MAEAGQESAAVQQKQRQVYVAAEVTAARHMGPKSGQCRCACVSSVNLLNIGSPYCTKEILYS